MLIEKLFFHGIVKLKFGQAISNVVTSYYMSSALACHTVFNEYRIRSMLIEREEARNAYISSMVGRKVWNRGIFFRISNPLEVNDI